MDERPDLIESLGRSVTSAHLDHREGRCDIDRVAALGMAGRRARIGALYIRLHAGQDGHAAGPLLAELAQSIRLRLRVPYSWRLAVARQALAEVMFAACQTCSGRGHVTAGNGVRHDCQACGGHRVAHYSDESRAAGIGVDLQSYRRLFASPLEAAIDRLRSSIGAARTRAREALQDVVLGD